MADKNTENSQKNKKRHRWIGIILIALLLLFIGLAGYYLERDLEPVPDNAVEDSTVIEDNGELGETGESEESASESESLTESETEISTEAELEVESELESESDDESESELESDLDQSIDSESEVETEVQPEEDQEDQDQQKLEQDQEIETEEELQEEEVETIEEVEQQEFDEQKESSAEEQVEEEAKKEESVETQTETALEKEETVEESVEDSLAEEETAVEEETPATEESITDRKETASEANDSIEKPEEESDALEREEEKIAVDSAAESDREEESTAAEDSDDLTQEVEDPTIIDRILSILGLSDSDFTQNLNILFVGLDDEESVDLGTIEADSIMLVKLRPEENMLQIEHIDEDTVYKGDLLRKYYNGNMQQAVEEITALNTDYFVYVKYLGFEKVIDELGGVKITLEEEVKVPGLGLNLKAGDNLLSGKEALNFVRWSDSDNLARFERQKSLINAVIAKLKGNNILFNVKDLYNTIVESYNSIETDINPVLAAEIFNYIRENKNLEIEFIE